MSWKPHVVTEEMVVDPGPVLALQSLLDDGLPTLGAGDPLPPLWHWVGLSQWACSGVLALDGHPQKGTFLPPVELSRRMFVGGRARFRAPIVIGSTVRCESEVISVVEKEGRAGRFVIVDVATRLYDEAGGLAIEEVQNIAYRGASAPGQHGEPAQQLTAAASMAPANRPLVRVGEWDWSLMTDPTILMRFSAATANAHRIHYDWPYATQVEGYPGLLVHGPLMTLVLAEVFRLESAAQAGRGSQKSGPMVTGHLTRLHHRNLAPLFCGMPARTVAVRGENGDTLQLVSDGTPRTSLTYWVE